MKTILFDKWEKNWSHASETDIHKSIHKLTRTYTVTGLILVAPCSQITYLVILNKKHTSPFSNVLQLNIQLKKLIRKVRCFLYLDLCSCICINVKKKYAYGEPNTINCSIIILLILNSDNRKPPLILKRTTSHKETSSLPFCLLLQYWTLIRFWI